MKETDRDPRPDLKEDHLLWSGVLITARRMNLPATKFNPNANKNESAGELFWLLWGLRSMGARLTKQDNGRLKLDYETGPVEISGWNKDSLLKEWLGPNKKNIAAVFKRAAA